MYESTRNLILSTPVFETLALTAYILILNLAS